MARKYISSSLNNGFDTDKVVNTCADKISTEFKHKKQAQDLSTTQVFYNEIAPHYNLRKPKGSKPTMVYFVCCINKKQVRISTGFKVYPKHWGKDKAIISNRQSIIDNKNNSLLNDKINAMNERFNEYKLYLCDERIEHSNQTFKNFMNNTKENNTDLIKHIKNAICKDDKADNTKENYLRFVSRFEDFLKTKETYVLNTALMNEFQQWCIDNMKTQNGSKVSPDTINNTVKKLMTILKNYGVMYGFIDKTTLDNILIKPLQVKKTDDEIALRGDEVTQIHRFKCDNKKDEEIKDLFVLECLTGQRISDIDKVANNIETKNGRTYINLVQEKTTEKIEVDIIFQIALDIIKKYNYKLPTYDRYTYNKRIKEICKDAGIKGTEITTKQEAGSGTVKKIEKERYECVSSHTGRRTFITLLSLMGYNYNDIARYSGHKTLEILRQYDKSKVGTKFKMMYEDTKKKHPELLPQLINMQVCKNQEIIKTNSNTDIKVSNKHNYELLFKNVDVYKSLFITNSINDEIQYNNEVYTLKQICNYLQTEIGKKDRYSLIKQILKESCNIPFISYEVFIKEIYDISLMEYTTCNHNEQITVDVDGNTVELDEIMSIEEIQEIYKERYIKYRCAELGINIEKIKKYLNKHITNI